MTRRPNVTLVAADGTRLASFGDRFGAPSNLRDLPPHHADPFDRLLGAQALAEKATLVTHDRALEPYGAPVIWT